MRRQGGALVTVVCLCVAWGCAARGHLTSQDQGCDEAAILRDLRTLGRSEAAYRSGNFGYYDVPECVATPAKCIPWYRPAGPVVVPPTEQLVSRRHGYVWQFRPGRTPERSTLPPDASRSSLLDWACTAVPAVRAARCPAYCVDSARRICRYAGGTLPRRIRAQCSLPCDRVE